MSFAARAARASEGFCPLCDAVLDYDRGVSVDEDEGGRCGACKISWRATTIGCGIALLPSRVLTGAERRVLYGSTRYCDC